MPEPDHYYCDIELAISAEQWLAIYRGQARYVVTRASNGKTVKFPAAILTPFLRHQGIYGAFRLVFDSERKFVAIEPR